MNTIDFTAHADRPGEIIHEYTPADPMNGDLTLITGQIALEPDRHCFSPGNISKQADFICQGIITALHESGFTPENVIHSYISINKETDLKIVTPVCMQYFPRTSITYSGPLDAHIPDGCVVKIVANALQSPERK